MDKDGWLYSQEVERNILGALILDNELYSQVENSLKEDLFFFLEHKKIYNAIVYLTSKSISASLDSLSLRLVEADFKFHGGVRKFLVLLAENLAGFIQITKQVNYLQELFTRRELRNLGRGIEASILDKEKLDVSFLVENIEKNLKSSLA